MNGVATYYGVIHRPPVSAGAVLVNMFCLQDILPVYAPVSVAWSLCAEIQFYLFFVLLLWAFQWLRERVPRRLARLVVFGPPADCVAAACRRPRSAVCAASISTIGIFSFWERWRIGP